MNDGAITHELTDRGWVSYFNDLHKGRNTGVAWSLFIDVFAFAALIFAAVCPFFYIIYCCFQLQGMARWALLNHATADAKTDRLLGVHILSSHAAELIAEATIAMEFAASCEDVARSFHPHPTLEEAIKEAALAVDKQAIHM